MILKPTSKLALKLAERIKNEIGEEVEPTIRRTRAGYWQRASGAWNWYMQCKNGFSVGAFEKATLVAKAKKWTISYHFNDIIIDIYSPSDNNQKSV